MSDGPSRAHPEAGRLDPKPSFAGRETPAARDLNSACPATVCKALLKSSAMLACETRPARSSVQSSPEPTADLNSRSARVDLPWPICAMGWNRGTEVFAQLFLQVTSFLKLLSHLGRLSGPGGTPMVAVGETCHSVLCWALMQPARSAAGLSNHNA